MNNNTFTIVFFLYFVGRCCDFVMVAEFTNTTSEFNHYCDFDCCKKKKVGDLHVNAKLEKAKSGIPTNGSSYTSYTGKVGFICFFCICSVAFCRTKKKKKKKKQQKKAKNKKPATVPQLAFLLYILHTVKLHSLVLYGYLDCYTTFEDWS